MYYRQQTVIVRALSPIFRISGDLDFLDSYSRPPQGLPRFIYIFLKADDHDECLVVLLGGAGFIMAANQ